MGRKLSFPYVEMLVPYGKKLQFLQMGTLVPYNGNCRFLLWELSFLLMETVLAPHVTVFEIILHRPVVNNR